MLLTVALTGCAFSPVNRPNVDRYLHQFLQSQVFATTIQGGAEASKSALEVMGYETLTVNIDIGLVRTKVRQVTLPDVCDCGTWNGGTIHGTADSTVIVNVESKTDKEVSVQVSTQCITNFTGHNLYGVTTRQETYQCASRGVVENAFWSALRRVLSAQHGPRSSNVSTGTCFAVAPDGLILTAYHLIKDENMITAKFENGDELLAVPEQVSANNDLALMRVNKPTPVYVSLSPLQNPKLGEPVFTLGFPAPSALGTEPKYTEGTVSALSGPGNESIFLQISVPVQPGNSGGPLVNYRGEVIGIITATAAILPFLQKTGGLPQNVNFAVKAGYARLLFSAPPMLPPASDRDRAIHRVRGALCTIKSTLEK